MYDNLGAFNMFAGILCTNLSNQFACGIDLYVAETKQKRVKVTVEWVFGSKSRHKRAKVFCLLL